VFGLEVLEGLLFWDIGQGIMGLSWNVGNPITNARRVTSQQRRPRLHPVRSLNFGLQILICVVHRQSAIKVLRGRVSGRMGMVGWRERG